LLHTIIIQRVVQEMTGSLMKHSCIINIIDKPVRVKKIQNGHSQMRVPVSFAVESSRFEVKCWRPKPLTSNFEPLNL
jgi:hypothetical protein